MLTAVNDVWLIEVEVSETRMFLSHAERLARLTRGYKGLGSRRHSLCRWTADIQRTPKESLFLDASTHVTPSPSFLWTQDSLGSSFFLDGRLVTVRE